MATDERLRVGSLFTGGGGLDYGFELAGLETAWQVEWDPWNLHLLEYGWGGRWRDVPRYADIHDVDFRTVAPVDVLVGGFPCQPVSVAGHRRAQLDERWLWPEYARAVRELRPRWVVIENVAGLLGPHGGLGDVLGALAEIGYDAEWTSFPASGLGAPHYRDRVWIIAYPGGSAPGRPLADGDDRHDDADRPIRARRAASHGGRPRSGDLPDASGGGRRPVDDLLPARQSDAARRGGDVPDAEGGAVRSRLREGQPSGIRRRRPRDGDRPARDVPDATRHGLGRRDEVESRSAGRPAGDGPDARDVPHALGDGERLARLGAPGATRARPDTAYPGWLADALADAARLGVEGDGTDWVVIPSAPTLALVLGRYGSGPGADLWAAEPAVGRMAHGVARRGDRLWTLGNGVVPSVAEVIGWLVRLADARL